MSCESIRVDNTISDDMLSSQQGINICLLQDEGLLQVGDFNQDCHIFIVKVIMKCAINLENVSFFHIHITSICIEHVLK